MTETITLLMAGEYSDRRVHAAYTDLNLAQAVCDWLNNTSGTRSRETFSLESVPKDPTQKDIEETLHFWTIDFYTANDQWTAHQYGLEVRNVGTLGVVTCWSQFSNKHRAYAVNVPADDEKQPLKAGMERINQWRAVNERNDHETTSADRDVPRVPRTV